MRALLEQAVEGGVCPGGVLVVGDGGRVVLREAFGRRALVPEPGPPVTPDTIYDAASLTKAAVTSLVVLRLVEAGVLGWETPLRRFLPDAQDVRVRDLLSHSAGLPAWRPMYTVARGRDAIVALAAAEPVERAPGEASVYSDLGFILLGALVEQAGGERLDALARRLVFAPAGMTSSSFVDLAAAWRPSPVAPTELTADRGLVCGEVHDENCHAAGGILGHAGLFTTGDDLARLCAALTDPDGPFPAPLLATMWSPCGVPGSTWRLGWDGPAQTGSSAGERWPKTGVGHLGFTGTSMWLDPPRRRWVVLLTNRVHPTRENQRIKELRPRVHDAVVALLDA